MKRVFLALSCAALPVSQPTQMCDTAAKAPHARIHPFAWACPGHCKLFVNKRNLGSNLKRCRS